MWWRMSSRVRPSDWPAKTRARSASLASSWSSSQADGRVRNPVKRLRAVRHLDGVAQAMLVEKGEPIESVLLVGRETGWGRRTGKSPRVNFLWNPARHVGVNGEQFRRRQHAP